ncbi:MAG TPA: hydrogenase maturation protease [Candidatus Elarobacter sp.]|jgi:hydrogenase maturation protease|nr:hydrogenase maturation protease [Candidatus Elarobacter sp.]
MILVAGVGNLFFGDDGFGPEVARALAQTPPDGTKVEDFGIRGLHLAYELLAGYERAVLVDLAPRGGAPGTLYVIEPDDVAPSQTPDAHRMDLQNVLGYLRALGGEPPPLTLVGCEPSSVEPEIGLSAPVAASVPAACALVRRLIEAHRAPAARTEGELAC